MSDIMKEITKERASDTAKGLEISRKYWEQCGRPVIERDFPGLLKYLAVGLVGSGSECFGFDDQLSRDHDFGPGFCIFLPGEELVSRQAAFQLERAYARLPKEFMGFTREPLNPVGGNRLGVFRTSEWFAEKTGIPGAPSGWQDFMALPDYALAEAVNGQIFFDQCGEYSEIRRAWQNPPKDYLYKKLCGSLLTMSQTGEYNYRRCLERGDLAAAHLTADEFVKAAISAVMWSFGRPVPYYKWAFRALRELEEETVREQGIEQEMQGRKENRQDGDAGSNIISNLLEEILFAKDGSLLIEDSIAQILELLKARNLVAQDARELQTVALEFNSRIKGAELRNLSPLAAF